MLRIDREPPPADLALRPRREQCRCLSSWVANVAQTADGIRWLAARAADSSPAVVTQDAPTLGPSSRPVRGEALGLAFASMVADVDRRLALGRARYGVELHTDSGRDLLVDAYQEALDGYLYRCAAMMEATEGTARHRLLRELVLRARVDCAMLRDLMGSTP